MTPPLANMAPAAAKPAPRQWRRQRTIDSIADAAMEILTRDGYEALTV